MLAGPTAVGKTALSVSLARAVGGEIISADSMQVYRYMDIGTAKITAGEMQGIRHHLIDVLLPEDAFNVTIFQKMAISAIDEIYARGKLPILVGGTGFYIQAVLYHIHFEENDGDDGYRGSLEALAATQGSESLHRMLEAIDPEAARQIHCNNTKKIIRALEFYHQTGIRISEHNAAQRQNVSPYHYAYFVLTENREALYERIDRRVDQMISDGLVDEVRALLARGCTRDMVSMQGLGYKEIIDYLEGRTSLEEAVAILKRDTRHFAKRQLTWFRRERNVIWLNRDQYESEQAILQAMLDILKAGFIDE